MKKLLLILLLFISFTAFSQEGYLPGKYYNVHNMITQHNVTYNNRPAYRTTYWKNVYAINVTYNVSTYDPRGFYYWRPFYNFTGWAWTFQWRYNYY